MAKRAARRVVRDYIKEHYDDEDIIPGAIEMVQRKPTAHGWMWLFDTPQDSYMKVRYDSEKSLFRVFAFEYENGSQVDADEVLHPHLSSSDSGKIYIIKVSMTEHCIGSVIMLNFE